MKFKEGKIVDIVYVNKGKELKPVIIRYPKKSDLRGVWKFYNKVIRETEFLSRVAPVTLKDEKKWLDDLLDGMRKGDRVNLVAEHDGKIVGNVGIQRKDNQRRSHAGGYGIAILREFTGMGLGKRMTMDVEKEARRMDLRILELSVFGRNKIAQNLYRKAGFKVIGKVPGMLKTRKGFDSEIFMYKVLK